MQQQPNTVRVQQAVKPQAQLACLRLQARPASPHATAGDGRMTLTYVGQLALCTQGHGQRGGRRQLRLVVRLGQPPDGVGVASLLAVLLGGELVPVGGGRTQSGQPQAGARGWGGAQAPRQEKGEPTGVPQAGGKQGNSASSPSAWGGCRTSRTLYGVPEAGPEGTEEAPAGLPGPQHRAF